METLAGIGLLACRFANALINANARRIGYVALGSVKLIRVACLLISTFFTLAGIGLLACRFANALINANARRIGYVALGSVKLIRDACLLISTFFNGKLWQELVCLPAVSLMR